MFDFLIDIIANNIEALASFPAVFPMGRLLKPRSSSSSSSSSSGGSSSNRREYTNNQGMRVRTSDPEPTPEPEPSSSGGGSSSPDPVEQDPEPQGATFEEVYGGIADSISPDQVANLRSIFEQDFVDQGAVGDVAEESRDQVSRGVNPVSDAERERVREIANQDFVDDNITERINNLFSPRSVNELEENTPDVDAAADEAVADMENNPLTSTEFASQFSGSDFMQEVESYQARLQELQDRLLEAMMPSEAELQTQEDLDQMRSSFRNAQETSRNRLAPEFAIRGELAKQNREFSIQRQGLVDDLEHMRNERSTRVDQLTQRMQFNDQNFKLMQDLQQLQTPNTRQFKTVDGVMYAIQENPLTGEISSKAVMNVPEDSNVQWQGFRRDATTGRIIRWGTEPDGDIIQQEMPEGFTADDVGIGQDSTGGGSGSGETQGGGASSFDQARQFVKDNPNASEAELVNWMRDNTDLAISDAKRAVEEIRGSEENDLSFTPTQFSSGARKAVNSVFGDIDTSWLPFYRGDKQKRLREAKRQAIERIEAGGFKIAGSRVKDQADTDKLVSEINSLTLDDLE